VHLTPLPRTLPIQPENDIMQGWKDPDGPPLVSVCCATYNHVAFIEDAICGVLGQQTDFRYEFIIRDDASTDGTTDIVKAYEAKYPDIIRAVIHTDNQYQKGIRPAHAWSQLAKGKYIAFCEGDDYWIDNRKLQQQVDILEANPDIILCAGGFYRANVQTGRNELDINKPAGVKPSHMGFFFTLADTSETWLTQFLTIVYRTEDRKHIPIPSRVIYGDLNLIYHLLKQGTGYYIMKPLGVYRIHNGGIYSKLGTKAKLLGSYSAYRELHMLYGDEYTRKLSLRHALLLIGYRSTPDNLDNVEVPRIRILRQSLGLARSFGDLKRIFRVAVPHMIKDLRHRFGR
jgi:glycosyltransferase involved in cell wall biosynthesis